MIIFLEKDNKLKCITDTDICNVLLSISKYKYFYGKTIKIRNSEFVFNGISLKYYEKCYENKKYKIDDIEVYSNIKIHQIELQKQKKEEHVTPQVLLNFFIREYENKLGVSYVINNKFNYFKKFRKLMDEFYINGFKDLHIKNYIKRCVNFGNHKGEPIYIDFLFSDKVLQNYLLFVKGLKDIDAIWTHLDTSISSIESKKIRYLMNLKLFDSFKQIEKDLCLKFYKIYDKKVYEKLLERYKQSKNIKGKIILFEILGKEYNMTIQELLEKTKHKKEYFLYEYTKKQIKEALK